MYDDGRRKGRRRRRPRNGDRHHGSRAGRCRYCPQALRGVGGAQRHPTCASMHGLLRHLLRYRTSTGPARGGKRWNAVETARKTPATGPSGSGNSAERTIHRPFMQEKSAVHDAHRRCMCWKPPEQHHPPSLHALEAAGTTPPTVPAQTGSPPERTRLPPVTLWKPVNCTRASASQPSNSAMSELRRPEHDQQQGGAQARPTGTPVTRRGEPTRIHPGHE